MTKHDFELIAKVISHLPDNTTKQSVANAFGAKLLVTNPRFNLNLFLEMAAPKTKAERQANTTP